MLLIFPGKCLAFSNTWTTDGEFALQISSGRAGLDSEKYAGYKRDKSIIGNLCRVLGTVAHSAINQSANLCMLQPGIVDYGKWEFSFMHKSQLFSVLLTDCQQTEPEKIFWPLYLSDLSFHHFLPFFHSLTLYGFRCSKTCHNFPGKTCSDLSKWLNLSLQESQQGPVVRGDENVQMHLGILLRSHHGHGE